jgi:hypothetical protein
MNETLPAPGTHETTLMHRRKMTIPVVLLCSVLFIYALVAYGTEDVVGPIQQAYDEGDIDRTEYLALKALQHPESLTPEQMQEIRKLLAFCYVALDDRPSAKAEFLKVLEVNPRTTLDPMLVSPKIISVFEEAKRDYRNKPPEKKTFDPKAIQLQASVRSLILPGWGQWKKGQRVRGYLFLSAQGIALGAWIGLAVHTNTLRDDYRSETVPAEIESSYQDYKDAMRYRNIAGIAALVVYVGAFFDVLYGPAPEPPAAFSMQLDRSGTPRVALSITF